MPVIIGKLVCWVPLLNTAAVEQDVDSVAVFEDGGDKGGDGVVGGEVGGVDGSFATEFLDGSFGFLG